MTLAAYSESGANVLHSWAALLIKHLSRPPDVPALSSGSYMR